jgi:hypothetical protein
VDYETGLEGDALTPKPILEVFVSGSQPTEEWNNKWQEITRLPWSLQKSFYMPKKGESADDAEESPSTTPAPSITPAAGKAN